jgi:alpha-tubulin suppressor-like RCC1 family protein
VFVVLGFSVFLGKLGIEDLTSTAVLVFQPVPSLISRKVKQVACGDYHTLCLLQDGTVYSWGGTLHKVIYAFLVGFFIYSWLF